MSKKYRFLILILSFAILLPTTLLAKPNYSRLKKKFKRALAAGDTTTQESIIEEVSQDDSKQAVDFLLKYALYPQIKTSTYEAILEALASFNSKSAIKRMVSKAKSGNWAVKVILCTIFARHSDESTEKALVHVLKKSKRVPVLRTAIKAAAKRKSKKAIPALIQLLKKYEKKQGVVWLDTRQALTSITGEDFEKAIMWEKWWKMNESRFDPNDVGEKKTATVKRKGPKFFTETIVSKRLIFIIDISGSMTAEDPKTDNGGGGVRIERAKRELIKVVKNLSKKVKFNIIAYSHVIKPWKKGFLAPASRGNKYSAIKFVQSLKPEGLTRTDKALEEAFKNAEANTFYLLTDGVPTKMGQGRAEMIPPQEILDKVRGWNRFRKIKIYTLGFAEMAKGPGGSTFVSFLKKLAEENDGKFSPIR
ncbi:MAG: VWA domain-containing protein [Planctomycetota bacterium]|nr:MAG: VWA domain-containing protein [Planctomycetota bacterium]